MDEIELLKKSLEREREARKAAEKTLEEKSLEIFRINGELRELNVILENLVNVQKKESLDLAKLTEENPDPILRMDFSGQMLLQNPQAKMMRSLRYKGTEYNASAFWKFFVQSAIYESVDSIEVSDESRVYHFTWSTFREQGYINIYGKDVTDTLTTSHRLKFLIENLHDGVLVEDEHRDIILVNDAFVNLFHIPMMTFEMIGQNCAGYAEISKLMFKAPDAFVTGIAGILRDRTIVLNEELELTDGRVFERDAIPIFVDKSFRGMMWKYRDITLRKSKEKILRFSEEKYRNIIRNMNLGLIEVDVKETILYANQSFCEMSGYSSEEVLGKNPTQIFLTKEMAHLMYQKNIARQQGISEVYEIQARIKTGETRWWMVSGAPLYDDNGMLKGSIGIHLDITKQKELEKSLTLARQEALASVKAKETFLTNMSHELRTPLNGIMGLVRDLRRSSEDDKVIKQLDSVYSAADHLSGILNDILDLTKIDSGKLTIEQVGFKMDEVLKRSIEVNKNKAEEKGLDLHFRIDSGVERVLIGDPLRVKQILINLIGNAIKFTNNGFVAVRCFVKQSIGSKQWITIEVEDSGIGMDKSFVLELFEKFSQADSSISRPNGGLGLGLNISKQLVELMQGTIQVQSELGRGSTFSVSIPFRIGSQVDIPMSVKTSSDEREFEGITVLVVEDNRLNQEVVRIALEYLHVKVDMVSNGRDAVERLRQVHYDIVFMDLQMPVLNGYDATSMIRRELNLTVPIIALTANALKGEREKCLEAGMDDFISKPFEDFDLIRVLRKHVVEKRSSNEEGRTFYDLSRLMQLSNGDIAFVKKMVGLFIKQAELTSSEMEVALEENNLIVIQKLAHKIKPAIENMGVLSLSSVVKDLEKPIEGDQVDWQDIRSKVNYFCTTLKETVVSLHKEV